MSREAMAIGSDQKPPVLFRGDYSQWKDRFLDFIDTHDLGDEILQSIQEGPAEFYIVIPPDNERQVPERRVRKTPANYSVEERNRVKGDKLARSYMLQGMTNEIYTNIDSNKTAKGIRDEIYKQMQGTDIGARIKVTNLSDFKEFDLILAMDKQNKEDLLAALERWSFKETLPADAYKKVKLMCFYCKKHDETEVPDPYYGGAQGFEKVLNLLEDACESLLDSILAENSSS